MKSIEELAEELVVFGHAGEVRAGWRDVVVAGVGIGNLPEYLRSALVGAVVKAMHRAVKHRDAFAISEPPCTQEEVQRSLLGLWNNHESISARNACLRKIEAYIAHLEAQVSWLARDTGHAESYQEGLRKGWEMARGECLAAHGLDYGNTESAIRVSEEVSLEPPG